MGREERPGTVDQERETVEPPPGLAAITADVAERLRFYVYALRDPRNQEVFYVGKGTGDRVYAHVRDACRGMKGADRTDSARLSRIRDIHGADLEVEHLLVRIGLESEDAAYTVEQAVIDAYKADGRTRGRLTNLAGGHHSGELGLATVDAACARLRAPDAPPLPAGSVLFIINREWRPDLGSDGVYEVTRGTWVMAESRRLRVERAFGVAGGVIRGAYRVVSWEEPASAEGKPRRWRFEGESDPALDRYVGASVRGLVPEAGAQNPVRYHL